MIVMIARDTIVIRTIQIGMLVTLLGAWTIATRSGDPVLKLFLPAPELVWREMSALIRSGQFWSALYVTVTSIAKAYAIAVIAGIAAGFAIARSRALVHLFEPVLSGLFAVPLTMFFPLFVLFFGIGPDSKVAYGATYAFFPIALNTIAAFANVDENYLRASRAMGASEWQQFRYVYMPAALPVTFTGLRIGFFICVASVLGGETLAATAGVGRATALAAELMETARLYAWIAFVVCMSVMLNLLALAVETRGERE
jgi:ABC-type nitrate/sulfonate/bicarbonate transport system permease component